MKTKKLRIKRIGKRPKDLIFPDWERIIDTDIDSIVNVRYFPLSEIQLLIKSWEKADKPDKFTVVIESNPKHKIYNIHVLADNQDVNFVIYDHSIPSKDFNLSTKKERKILIRAHTLKKSPSRLSMSISHQLLLLNLINLQMIDRKTWTYHTNGIEMLYYDIDKKKHTVYVHLSEVESKDQIKLNLPKKPVPKMSMGTLNFMVMKPEKIERFDKITVNICEGIKNVMKKIFKRIIFFIDYFSNFP